MACWLEKYFTFGEQINKKESPYYLYIFLYFGIEKIRGNKWNIIFLNTQSLSMFEVWRLIKMWTCNREVHLMESSSISLPVPCQFLANFSVHLTHQLLSFYSNLALNLNGVKICDFKNLSRKGGKLCENIRKYFLYHKKEHFWKENKYLVIFDRNPHILNFLDNFFFQI